MNVRILVLSDDAFARAGLAVLLSQQSGVLVTGQISNAELPDAIPLYRPDVIVWDASGNVNVRDASVPVLALLSDASEAVSAWNAGARGLLLRTASAETIASVAATLAEGLVVIDPLFAAQLFPARDQPPTQPIEELTPRELQVLRLIAEGQSNKEIARALGISEHTVKFHVNAILGKLNVQSRTEAVVHATRLGLILL
jgi:DNA-binding NarL/FixJ family response regulator